MSTSARVRLSTILGQARKQHLQQKKKKGMELPLHQKFKVVRGDKVQVIARQHPEAGKQGIVKAVLRQSVPPRVIVEGVNVKTRHVKGNPDRGIAGRSVQEERSLPLSAVSLVDPVSNAPTRIFRSFLEDGTKVRVSKKSGAVIPRPSLLNFRKRPVNTVATASDTSDPKDVWEITYDRYRHPAGAAGGAGGDGPA
jgi:large subunit ribosomal protein L24